MLQLFWGHSSYRSSEIHTLVFLQTSCATNCDCCRCKHPSKPSSRASTPSSLSLLCTHSPCGHCSPHLPAHRAGAAVSKQPAEAEPAPAVPHSPPQQPGTADNVSHHALWLMAKCETPACICVLNYYHHHFLLVITNFCSNTSIIIIIIFYFSF